MLRIVGVALTLIGLAAAVAGWVWNALWPHPDANIGAGMLVVLGLPVAGIGVVLLIVAAVVSRPSR
ncbi:hypothetical protein [Pseudolysinimonas sp.]